MHVQVHMYTRRVHTNTNAFWKFASNLLQISWEMAWFSSGIHVSTLNMQHSGSAMIFQPKRWNFRAKPTPTEKPPFFFDENLFIFSSRMKMDPFNKSMLRCCCCCFRPYGIKVYYYWTSKTPFFVIDCMPLLTHTPLITILVRSFVCLENEKISIFAHLFCP